ncbi:hypothetical protein [Amycolatopsis nalaikhensis]|uniref:Uncharacterized protein n=1 Tax=Amycolatopsis nalaikhensis TaxID=715472 RepID=A0ABY8XWQ6_9PSEU|nr:hypothetical protein [Amycolatopsis sp. 2-2]WIV60113.1 hypothetical protein QP939_16595 [Amycolatopsis sp. 2-2]
MNVPAQLFALAAALTHLWIFTMDSVRFSRLEWTLTTAARGGPEPIALGLHRRRAVAAVTAARARVGVSRTEFISHTAIRQLRWLGFPLSPLRTIVWDGWNRTWRAPMANLSTRESPPRA